MKHPLIIVGLIIVALGVGVYFLSGRTSAPATGGQGADTTAKEFTLRIEGKKLVDGAETLTVQKGDVVLITVFSDEPEEFHLHGYDKSIDLTPGVGAELRLVADTAGRFPAELEESKTDITTLEVLP